MPSPELERKKRPVFYLMLDAETTSENTPQLVSLEAELYDEAFCLLWELSSVVKPRRGYAALTHAQDVRYHGVTAEMMADHGDDAAEALGNLLRMIRQGTGVASLSDVSNDDDGPVIIVVAHGCQGMISNLMAAVRVDETLQQYWDELEALCQRTHDTLHRSARNILGVRRCTLEWSLAALGEPLPKTKARALAMLYFKLIKEDGEW